MQESITVRRVLVRAFGGPEQLTPETVPQALRVGAEELLVDVEAAGINYLDVYQRSGRYKLPLPYTPGFEGVGRVRQVGAGVSGVFMETHPRPDEALCDGPNSLQLKHMQELLETLVAIDALVKKNPPLEMRL